MLRTALLTSAVALGLAMAAPAFAQTNGPTWTGPYLGANLGYGGGDFRYPYSGTSDIAGTSPTSGTLTQSSSGVLGGVQAGYNYQMPNGFVLGLETDFDASDVGGVTDYNAATANGGLATGTLQSRIDYLGTLRGRIGEPLLGGRIMPYVTGGFAYGGVRALSGASCSSCLASATPYGASQIQTGWTVGAGAEVPINRRLSMKVEYLYVNLDQRNLAGPDDQVGTPAGPVYNAAVAESATANIVRVGLNYHF